MKTHIRMEEPRPGINMRVLAGATKDDILRAINPVKVQAYLKQDSDIEGVRATGVFEPILLSKEEKALDSSKDGSPECHSNGIYLPCQ